MNQTGTQNSDRIDPTIGERLTVIRRRRGISQRQLAKHADMSATVLNRLERGLQCVTAERIATLARLLETSTDYLLGLTSTTRTPRDSHPGHGASPGLSPCERETASPHQSARRPL